MVKLDSDRFGAKTELVGSQTWTKVLKLANGSAPCTKANLSEFDDLQ
jgi:hypothetical protein